MIRIAGYPDFSHMARIHAANFVRGWKAEEIRELMEKPGMKGFIYDIEGSRAGFVLMQMVEDEAEIIAIAVDKFHQRKGIASRILEFVMQYAQREGVESLFLEVAEDNLAAVGLYQKHAFETFNQRKDYYQRWHGGRVNALMMRHSLKSPKKS